VISYAACLLQDAADFVVLMENQQPFVQLQAPVYPPAPVLPNNVAFTGGEHPMLHCAPEALTRIVLKHIIKQYSLRLIWVQSQYQKVCFP
jgi:hypothetical protein